MYYYTVFNMAQNNSLDHALSEINLTIPTATKGNCLTFDRHSQMVSKLHKQSQTVLVQSNEWGMKDWLACVTDWQKLCNQHKYKHQRFSCKVGSLCPAHLNSNTNTSKVQVWCCVALLWSDIEHHQNINVKIKTITIKKIKRHKK